MTDFRTAASGGAKETQPTEQPSARGGCGLPVSDCHLHFRAAACGGRTSFGEVRASAAGGCGPPALRAEEKWKIENEGRWLWTKN